MKKNLKEIKKTINENKKIIATTMISCMALTLAYVNFAEKKYTAEAGIISTQESEVTKNNLNAKIINYITANSFSDKELNQGSIEINISNQNEMYGIFIKNINSIKLRKEFFEKFYQDQIKTEEEWEKFKENIKITSSNIQNKLITKVYATDTNPEVAAKLANNYSQFIIEKSENEIKNNLKTSIKIINHILEERVKIADNQEEKTIKNNLNIIKSLDIDQVTIKPATQDIIAIPLKKPTYPNKILLLNIGFIISLALSLLICSARTALNKDDN
ncbi:Wzz/FepE/Etk N-terminal domain-containing protein [Alcaligenes aquatilis]|uniref:Polysaccharide chain length determinant N-terminal domain-containing protein n=1 Tax=Alcaligenes aquatilis TaxID=323284 RepID=A0A3G2HYU8_9BURK|nr:Wzz/FepE/Etk N-terminal domain-containing protein [Alcaligenes aquatilis]AYN22213.1 hypothetical protein D3M96_17685 [Alcaligenes aquatilis]